MDEQYDEKMISASECLFARKFDMDKHPEIVTYIKICWPMNDTQYLVSICVPVYGVEKYIERCAVSLFEQTYQNIEYIFVNDCTSDKSIGVLKSVIERYPNRKSHVHIITHEKNRGLGAARNTAVDAVRGEFLMHVDSDDWIDKDCVRLCVEKQIETGADIVSTEILRVRKDKTIVHHIPDYSEIKDFVLALINHSIPNNIWGRLIRLSLYRANNIKVEAGVNFSEDLNVMPRLAYFAKKIAIVPQTLYYYECRNQNSYTSSFSEENYLQTMMTCDILSAFFSHKESVYNKALEVRLYTSLVDNLINLAKRNGNIKSYYNIRLEIDKMPGYLKNTLSLPHKMAINIINYHCFCMFVRSLSFVKHLLQ